MDQWVCPFGHANAGWWLMPRESQWPLMSVLSAQRIAASRIAFALACVAVRAACDAENDDVDSAFSMALSSDERVLRNAGLWTERGGR